MGRDTHDILAQPLELDDVRREHGAPVNLDEGNILSDHVQPVCVENDVHAPLLGDVQRDLRERLHVVFAAEPRADNQNVQAREET